MKFVKLAIVLLPPCTGQYPTLLQRDFAGIKMLERLILTLQRAGLNSITILSQGTMGDIREKTEENTVNDSRFEAEITWYEQTKNKNKEIWQHIQSRIGSQNFLLLNGNMVVTTTTIQDFIEKASQEGVFEPDEIVGLGGPKIKPGNIFLSPSSQLDALKNHIKNPNTQRLGNVLSLDGPKHFAKLVEDEPTARQTERNFINLHKHHYSQFMDFWVSSYFSLKISSLLVRTSITPNAVTLLGLLIGLFAAWQFSHGDYWGGLLGGLAFVGTAIWDCCDGDIARLKFMESDFGDTLDTTCDNLNNVFAFTGIMIGVAMNSGFSHALIPYTLLGIGGSLIFYFIYFPKGGKGSFFHGTWMYDLIEHLASRNFVYIVLLFGIFGHMDWFLWLSGFGANFFAVALYISKKRFLER